MLARAGLVLLAGGSAAALPSPAQSHGDAAFVCTTKKDAADKDLNTALGWVCSPPPSGGGANCSAINTGGSHWLPNDSVDHAKYAFDQFYQAKQHGISDYDICFFGSTAFLTPAPAGHFHFVQGGDMLYPTAAQQGMGLWDTLAVKSSVSYVSPAFTGKYTGTATPGSGLTLFSVWIAGTAANAKCHAEVSYDFGSAGKRTEIYNSRPMDVVPKYQAYTNAMMTMIPPTGNFTDATGAKVTVTLVNDGAVPIQVLLSAPSSPSFVSAPYL